MTVNSSIQAVYTTFYLRNHSDRLPDHERMKPLTVKYRMKFYQGQVEKRDQGKHWSSFYPLMSTARGAKAEKPC